MQSNSLQVSLHLYRNDSLLVKLSSGKWFSFSKPFSFSAFSTASSHKLPSTWDMSPSMVMSGYSPSRHQSFKIIFHQFDIEQLGAVLWQLKTIKMVQMMIELSVWTAISHTHSWASFLYRFYYRATSFRAIVFNYKLSLNISWFGFNAENDMLKNILNSTVFSYLDKITF